MLFLPVKKEPNQRFSVILDNQNCTIEIFQRFDHLYLNLFVDDVAVVQGVLCHNNLGITAVDTLAFRGMLYFTDVQGDSDPQYEGLGTRYYLIFVPEGDMVSNVST